MPSPDGTCSARGPLIALGARNPPARIISPVLQCEEKESGVRFHQPEIIENLKNPAVTQAARRFAASEFLAEVSHKLELTDENGKLRTVFNAENLPGGDFEVSLINFGRAFYVPEDLSRILTLSEVRVIWLEGPIPSEDFLRLGQLQKLESLTLVGAEVTNSAFQNIEGFTKLKKLEIIDCPNLSGALDLSRFVSLDSLRISACGITDVRPLAHCPHLRHLSIHSSALTDEGLNFLSPPPKLEQISLNKLKISDAGILHLARIPTLNFVHTGRTEGVTASGAEALSAKLPNWKIVYGKEGNFVTLEPEENN